MARNPIIQVTCPPSLYTRLENYRNKTPHASMSDIGRELLDFALLIKERSEEADSRTNRELMEQMLLKQYENEQLIKKIYSFAWEDGKQFTSMMAEIMREDVGNASRKGQDLFEAYMNKEDASDK